MNSSSSCILSQSEQEKLIYKLEIFKIQGRDKPGRLLHTTGKLFPARLIGAEAIKKYWKQNVFP